MISRQGHGVATATVFIFLTEPYFEMHCPLLQVCAEVQEVPHCPQLRTSVLTSVHLLTRPHASFVDWPQSVSPWGQVH
jgi:hypothetical protein